MSNPKVITPPSQVITTAVAKVHLRASSATTEDTLIDSFIVAAHAKAEHYTNRSLGSQTLEIALDEFPAGGAAIELPRGPVTSITSVIYIDEDEIAQTISSDNYSLDSYNTPGWVIPAVDYEWPTPIDAANCVKVRYVAGDFPDAAKAAILLLTQALYDRGEGAAMLEKAAFAQLDTLRQYG